MNINVDKYVTLKLEDYKGTYSIKEGYIKDGEWLPTTCKRVFKGVEKKSPLSVRIGDKETALAVLTLIYEEISGGSCPF